MLIKTNWIYSNYCENGLYKKRAMKNYPIQAYKTSKLRSQVLALRISSANVTKSVGNCGFTEEILNGKVHFLCSVSSILTKCVPTEALKNCSKINWSFFEDLVWIRFIGSLQLGLLKIDFRGKFTVKGKSYPSSSLDCRQNSCETMYWAIFFTPVRILIISKRTSYLTQSILERFDKERC